MGHALRRSLKRRICFVTGTRAEFGLMHPVLRAIQAHTGLALQLVVTGMHLQSRHGRSIDQIRRDGWTVDAVVSWSAASGPVALGEQTGKAIAALSRTFEKLQSDIVLVVGDRVEPFAAAAAAHLTHHVVAHVHGGDRALGQVDDTLRHAITKLSHIHFPATPMSAKRIIRLGEDRWRIHTVGAPGIDGIESQAAEHDLPRHRYAMLVVHPMDTDEQTEFSRARMILRAVAGFDFESIVIIHPNNDPGSEGIARCWNTLATGGRYRVYKNLDRPRFLGMLRDAAVLVGNSSSGIIEAASFGTPVVDIGPRQQGRDRSQNVTNVPYQADSIRRAIGRVWNRGRPKRFRGANIYGGTGAGQRIARILADLPLDAPLRQKLIAY